MASGRITGYEEFGYAVSSPISLLDQDRAAGLRGFYSPEQVAAAKSGRIFTPARLSLGRFPGKVVSMSEYSACIVPAENSR